jgi:Protein of unknown function (DUF4236)
MAAAAAVCSPVSTTLTGTTTASPASSTDGRMPFRFFRRKSLGNGFWVGLSKSGASFGRRGTRFSASISRRGPSASVRLAKGLSYIFLR